MAFDLWPLHKKNAMVKFADVIVVVNAQPVEAVASLSGFYPPKFGIEIGHNFLPVLV